MHLRIANFASLLGLLGSALALGAVACGPDKPADAPVTQTPATTASSAAPSASVATTAAAPTGDPAAKARFDALEATPLAAAVSGAKADDIYARGLVDTAKQFDASLQADGPFYKVTLAEKGKAHVDLTLKAGKCYALIGFARLGTLVDYDLNVLSQTGDNVGHDDDDDSTPTVGKPLMCPTADTSYAVELYADHGAGDAAVQLFSKSK